MERTERESRYNGTTSQHQQRKERSNSGSSKARSFLHQSGTLWPLEEREERGRREKREMEEKKKWNCSILFWEKKKSREELTGKQMEGVAHECQRLREISSDHFDTKETQTQDGDKDQLALVFGRLACNHHPLADDGRRRLWS